MAGRNTDEAIQSTAPRDLQEVSGRGRADRQSIQRCNIPPSRQTNSLHQRVDILERTENLDHLHLPADRGSPDTGSRHSLFLRLDQLQRTGYKNPRSTPQELLRSPMGRTPHGRRRPPGTSPRKPQAACAAKCGEDLDAQKHQDDWMVLMASASCPVAMATISHRIESPPMMMPAMDIPLLVARPSFAACTPR